ncbi:TPA: helix-turn-helix domain-containing protein [Bacillus tropicus]|nr:helix-turn-helix domain-containing protein [Bacillus tropicus]AIY72972.1 anthrax toxin expression trans-acting positive regulator [Bacillus cereus]AJI07941.1 anthrax toxin expression trans-acting positive regulator [Bacillus cereus G9241]EAL15968.1 trans-acting positive regulator [Bacillus cereus G9241]QPS53452.1 helix-turn-helix domain-containing protein [Bacillus tropicus]
MLKPISIEKEHVKLINLLHYINEQNRWFTIKELSDYLQVADKTVRKYLKLLEDEIPFSWNLIIQKGKGIYLEKPLDESLSFVESQILRKSLNLKICEELVFKKNTIQTLAQKLHLQVSALYPIINRINCDIQSSNLSIKKRPLEIIGREQDIRIFMLRLYANIPNDYWPFPYINKYNIIDLITKVERKLDIQLYTYSKHKLCVLFAISISRLLSRNTIGNVSKLVVVNKDDVHFQAIASIAIELQNSFGVTLNETEISFLSFALLLSLGNSITTDSSTTLTSFAKALMPLAKEITKVIENKLQIGVDYNEPFLTYVVLIIKKALDKNFIQHFNYNVQFINNVQKRHSNTFQTIKECINNLNYTVKSHFDCYEISLLTMHFETQRLLFKSTTKKLYVYTSQGCIHRSYISALLEKRYHGFIKVIKDARINPKYETLQEMGVDVIISNVNLPIKNIPIVQISDFPTERDFDEIKKFIQ